MEPQDASPQDAGGAAAATGAGEKDLAVLESVEAELHDVDRALARLDDGTYGTCEACGATLPDEHLAAAPAARFCAQHRPTP